MSNDASPKELGLDRESRPLDPSPSLSVSLVTVDGRRTLLMRRRLDGDGPSIWAHVTEPRLLSAWAPYTASRPLDAPGEMNLTVLGVDAAPEPTPSDIVFEVYPLRTLEHSWGTDVVRWELAPADDGTELELRQTLADPEMTSAVAAGWHLCLDVLARLVDGEAAEPVRGPGAREHGWDDLNDRYATELGVTPTRML